MGEPHEGGREQGDAVPGRPGLSAGGAGGVGPHACEAPEALSARPADEAAGGPGVQEGLRASVRAIVRGVLFCA